MPQDTRKRDRFKATFRDLFHRGELCLDLFGVVSGHDINESDPPSPKNDNPAPALSAAHVEFNNRTSSSAPPGHTTSAIDDAETLPSLIPLSKKPPKETLLQRYPNATSFMKGSLELAVIIAEASPVPGMSLAIVAIQHLVEFAEVCSHLGSLQGALDRLISLCLQ